MYINELQKKMFWIVFIYFSTNFCIVKMTDPFLCGLKQSTKAISFPPIKLSMNFVFVNKWNRCHTQSAPFDKNILVEIVRSYKTKHVVIVFFSLCYQLTEIMFEKVSNLINNIMITYWPKILSLLIQFCIEILRINRN